MWPKMDLGEVTLNILLKNFGGLWDACGEARTHKDIPSLLHDSSSRPTLPASLPSSQEVQELESITGGWGLRDNALHSTSNLST